MTTETEKTAHRVCDRYEVEGIDSWHPMRDDEPYPHFTVLHDKPSRWRHAASVLAGWVIFGLLCWAAVYELRNFH